MAKYKIAHFIPDLSTRLATFSEKMSFDGIIFKPLSIFNCSVDKVAGQGLQQKKGEIYNVHLPAKQILGGLD